MQKDDIKCLLVDDLEENLLALEGLLRRDGLTMLKARTGPQALEFLLVHDVALAIVDVQMPDMDGFELAELMRGTERTRRVPIIFVTAGAVDTQRRFKGYDAGAVDFLVKPIEPRILQSKAEIFFELYRQRQEVARQRDQLRRAAEENARLLAESRRAEEALRALNATLESKVAQRTAQLEHRARQLQKLTLELSQTEDRERKRMADILHDDLQQQLAAAKFHLSLLSNRLRDAPALLAVTDKLDQLLSEAVEKSRSLSHDLCPSVLYQGSLEHAFEWLARQMQVRHGLLVRVDAHDEIHVQSDAMKAFLYRAGQELLFNVVKHARVPETRIRLRRFGPYVGLLVADRGRGFDPQGLRKTTGFGLFSIRERVKLLGGRMKIKSEAGKGSAFFVVVPDGRTTDDAEEPAEDQSSSPASRPLASVLRVLLADDHEVVRQGLKGILSEQSDVEVVGEATNGREAVDLAWQLKPDVIIMDISMPLINGVEATRQVKAHLPDTRVVALSMYDEPERAEMMSRAGAESYILKTAPSEQLLAAVRGAGPANRSPASELR